MLISDLGDGLSAFDIGTSLHGSQTLHNCALQETEGPKIALIIHIMF